jgi:hypothetical protein
MSEEFNFDDLEKEINKFPKNIESVAFNEWKERGYLGFHSKESKYSDCRHFKKTLDSDSRMVRCDECQAYLDPFDCLKRLVREREYKQRNALYMKDEFDGLYAKINDAKKELKSLNGKIKRRKKNA